MSPLSFSVFIIKITVLREAKYKLITKPETTTTVGERARRQDNNITSPIEVIPPTKATKLAEKSSIQGVNNVASMSVKFAPLATPKVVGDANGLRRTCCINTPATAKPAPESTVVNTRGHQLK
ncbi:hypothetical protein THOB06_60013 [Vibrio rotiferianus]|nr:hypothetical protein THOG10_60013 [Vibrio rotiferianus]CAH1592834.1 hypothetical protein THOB06_60013 [Vibrio rotiferianus]